MEKTDRNRKLITFGIVTLMVVVGVVLIILLANSRHEPHSHVTPTSTPPPTPVSTVTPIPGETEQPTEPPTQTDAPARLTVSLEDPASKVNLRHTPSTEGDNIIEALSDGTVLTPMDIVGQWFKVTYQGQIGYIKTDFVKLSGTLNGKIQLSDPASKVNLRGTASADGAIVTELADGTLLDVTSVTSDWIQVKVKDGGQTGYVKSDFVKLIY